MKQKQKFFLIILSSLLTLSMVLTGCNGDAETTSPTTEPTTAATATPTEYSNWWDSFGEPEYGGTITIRANDIDALPFDWLASPMGNTRQLWIEGLFGYDETVDRDTWAFQTDFAPVEYHVGVLAESWEQVDAETIIVHLRQGIHWQNIEPVNGREFTAEDVQFTYDRVLGTGSGYAEPHPFFASQIDLIKKVTATDKYTVEVKFNHPTAVGIFQLFSGFINIGAPECAELYGEDASDTRNAVGTGPWMLDTVEYGTSISYVKNPDYWGEDARYPGNQVPYLDSMCTGDTGYLHRHVRNADRQDRHYLRDRQWSYLAGCQGPGTN